MSTNPLVDERPVIEERQLAFVELGDATDRWKLDAELHIPAHHVGSATGCMVTARGPKPVSHSGDRGTDVIVMCADVLPSDIGAEDLVSIRITIEYETRFPRVSRAS